MSIASVIFKSPLPQLDKVFDYNVPKEFEQLLRFGMMVKVPFGRSKSMKTGIVVNLSPESAHAGELQSIVEVVSATGVITRNQYELMRAVANRQAGTVGELLGTALPDRSVRAEKLYVNKSSSSEFARATEGAPTIKQVKRQFVEPSIVGSRGETHWCNFIVQEAKRSLALGESVLVILPDFKDLTSFEEQLHSAGLADIAIRQSSSDTLQTRWTNQLRAIGEDARVIYGTRLAAFSPVRNLGHIFVWDDGDESHYEQSSPYWNSRDVALIRSEKENCDLTFLAHSPSSEVCRLIEISYLQRSQLNTQLPAVRITESTERIDAETHSLISKILGNGDSVLIQVSKLGFASALICVSCREILRCSSCSTPLWLDPQRIARCRNCKKVQNETCPCGSGGYRPTSLGSHALVEQLTNSFPKATVVNSTGIERIMKLSGKSMLVIATPGAEPMHEEGYKLIVFADAVSMLGVPRLRSLEEACRRWANAVSFAAIDGLLIFVGISGEMSDQLRRLNFFDIVRADTRERIEIGLPPATRLASIVSRNQSDLLSAAEQIRVQLPSLVSVPTALSNTIAFSYAISEGPETANHLKAIVEKITRSSKNKFPGQRVLFINMDDRRAI